MIRCRSSALVAVAHCRLRARTARTTSAAATSNPLLPRQKPASDYCCCRQNTRTATSGNIVSRQETALQHKPKLFNVLDCIDIHEYVSPSLLLLLLSLVILLLATVLRLHYCCVTALLLMLLLYSYSCVAVPATHTNAKVTCDVTCCDVTCYSTNNHLLMIISIIFKNSRYHTYFEFDSYVISNCTPYL